MKYSEDSVLLLCSHPRLSGAPVVNGLEAVILANHLKLRNNLPCGPIRRTVT